MISFVKAHACGNDFLILEEKLANGNHAELARQLCRSFVQQMRVCGQSVFRQHNRCPAKTIGFDDIRSRFKIFSVDVQHHVRPRSNQVFVATFERSSAKVRRIQLPLLQHRTHRAVQHEDSLREQLPQRFGRFV